VTEDPTIPEGDGAECASSLLRVRGINKAFPGVQALADVDLDIHAGRVHALVGENGAGKSTLVGILGGAQRPDDGSLELEGEPVAFTAPRHALERGVVVVYQELSLLPHLTVAENILLGHAPARRGVIDRKGSHERARELLTSLAASDLPTDVPVRRLSIAQQQLVEIAKALAFDAKVLILDEPSAVLAGDELERLFEVILRLRDRGVAIVYISHRLAEIDRIADEVTVLRDGRRIVTTETSGMTRQELIRSMVGRDLVEAYGEAQAEPSSTVLEVERLLLPGTEPEGINFSVRAGEILGVAGLMGSGRSRLARALVGLEPTAGGRVAVDGKQVTLKGPRAAAKAGIALVPEDRKQMGLLLGFSVERNISLPVLHQVTHGGILSRRDERTLARRFVDAMAIRTSSVRQVARQLSGGNQQKVVLAKWLATDPRVLVLDEPLRGVDVGAKAEIYDLIRNLAGHGTAIVLVSSELLEVLGLSDRIVVMNEGRLKATLDAATATEEQILDLAIQDER